MRGLHSEVASQLEGYHKALGLSERECALDVAVWFHTGTVCRASGRFDEAVACFKKAIELAPDDPWAYWELAGLYAEQGDPRPAVVVLAELAQHLAARSRLDEAMSAWRRAANLAPHDLDALEELREAAARAGHPLEVARVDAAIHALRDGQSQGPAPNGEVSAPAVVGSPSRSLRPMPAPVRDDRAPATAGPPDVAPEPGTDDAKARRARRGVLGEILLAEGWITSDQLVSAVQVQQRTRRALGTILVEMGALTEEKLAQGLALQWGLSHTSLADGTIDPDAARFIPDYLARRHGVVPVRREQNRLVVAMTDPSNVLAIDDIRLVTGLDVDILVASPSDIARVRSTIYDGQADIETILKDTGIEPETIEEPHRGDEITVEHLRTMVEDAPIVRAVNKTITQAILLQASDVHIEPQRGEVKVRFRIDGILQDFMSTPRSVQAPLISRVKILANMDIAERRLPQDGHIHMRMEGRDLDLRVSTLPTVLGEKVVIRILDQSRMRLTLPQLGFAGDLLATWEGLITKPYGLILVTGPTGSGKTTTLYSSLGRINTPERNIVSVEDPVEYQIPRVNQVQVNPKIGLTFANGLRTILRQDPDVVLIGEIRDRETAEIAVQASMTGHLVLSTVHTNDAPGAVTRLMDMGVEPFLITSSLIGILAQRLVRVTCDRCKEAYAPPADALHRLGMDPSQVEDVRLYRGRGCDTCRHTGYRGRLGVFELMVMTDELRRLVLSGASADVIREAAQRSGMRTLRQSGVDKVLEGVTTFEEMLRVVFVNEE
jgi:type IV pilus assembly protein PilB